MIEMQSANQAWHRPRKEPMTLDERKTGIYNEWRRDPDMVRSVAECIGSNADFIKAMDDYLVLTVTTGLTAAATRDAAAKLQSMMAAKLRDWADSAAEDVHRKQITEAA